MKIQIMKQLKRWNITKSTVTVDVQCFQPFSDLPKFTAIDRINPHKMVTKMVTCRAGRIKKEAP